MDSESSSTLGSMIESIISDFSKLIRGHIALAKAELQVSAVNALRSVALFIIAIIFGHFALVLLLISAGYGLVAAGLAPWFAFLVIALVVILLGSIAMIIAIRFFKKVRPPVRTMNALSETADTIQLRD